MLEPQPLPPNLDAMWHAAMQSVRCVAVDGGRRCQLASRHPGWPHVHAWMTGARRTLQVHQWVWDDGLSGQEIALDPLATPPPYVALFIK